MLLVIGIALAMQQVESFTCTGYVVAGVVLATTIPSQTETDIRAGVVGGLFFISVGANFNLLLQPLLILGLVIGLALLSLPYCSGWSILQVGLSQSLLFACALAPSALLCYSLAPSKQC